MSNTKQTQAVSAVVKGSNLVITVPLNTDRAYVGQRGTRIYERSKFIKATGEYDGKPVAFTVTAVEGR